MGFADLDRFDSLQSPVAHDDNLWRGEFPPRQANSGLVEDPGLRRAASMIAVIAGIARDRKCKTYHRGIENSKARR